MLGSVQAGLETITKGPTIPKEAIVSMVRIMTGLGLVDVALACSLAEDLA